MSGSDSSFSKYLLVLFSALLLTACSGDDDADSTIPPEPIPDLNLTFSESPVDLTGIAAQFTADVPYGDGERNVFDIYLPDSDEPTPLVIYVHGGGFTGGSKESLHGQAATVQDLLSRGIAVATINYYLLTVTPPDTDGVIRSLNDSKRALQFMRYQAKNLNIDPENIAMYGASAGAGTAIWLGSHDEMAQPDNEDPVLRQSTRINAVGAIATQATYDVIRWEEVLYDAILPLAGTLGGTDIITIAEFVGQTDLLKAFLAIPTLDNLNAPDTLAYRKNIDMLDLMDSSDAPLWISNFTPSILNVVDYMFHHSLHAIALKDAAEMVGLNSVVYYTDGDAIYEDPTGEEMVSFLVRHIQ